MGRAIGKSTKKRWLKYSGRYVKVCSRCDRVPSVGRLFPCWCGVPEFEREYEAGLIYQDRGVPHTSSW